MGIYAGIAALLEIPFMLGWGYLAGKVSKEIIMVYSALVFALYVVLVSRATTVSEVFWLQGLNRFASCALFSITISYMQAPSKGGVDYPPR
ncbi:MAG TPA: hypothetical protein VL147_12620 [Devosia sp.]|nr:hypothetical protein [Devosia sp.]